MSRFFAIVVVCLAVFGFLLFGCAGQGGQPPLPGINNSSISSVAPNSSTVQPPKTVSPEQAASDLVRIFEKQPSLDYTVNYLIAMGQAAPYNTAVYVKTNPTKVMVETDGKDALRTYGINGLEYDCSKLNKAWLCPLYGGRVLLATPPISNVMATLKKSQNYTVEWAGNQVLAGVTSSCYNVGFKVDHLQALDELCFSPEGVLLYLGNEYYSSSSASLIKISDWTASKYSIGVDDSVFNMNIKGEVAQKFAIYNITYSSGTGGAGYTESLSLGESGLYTYTLEPSNTNRSAVNKTHVLPLGVIDKLVDLTLLMNKTDVNAFEDQYVCKANCANDLPTSTLSFSINGKNKTISINQQADLPPELDEILANMKEIMAQVSMPQA